MEAKDTVMSQETLHKEYFDNVLPWPASRARNAVEAQAEISFKAGFNEALNTVVATREYDEGEHAGRKEVVEWFRQYAIHGGKMVLEDVIIDLEAHSPYGKPH